MTENSSIEFDPQIASNSSNLTINSFQKAFAEGTLELRPAFQRNLVWNDEQQSYLIDTVLRGLPVPEVYIQTQVSADGDEKRVVVDGQQRINACLKFLNGQLVLLGSNLDIRWSGKTFADLSAPLKKRFRSFQLVVRELPDVDETVLRQIFGRLNKTVEALEPQELRHAAYTGLFIVLVEEAASQPVLAELGVFSAKDFQRRRNDEFLAEVLFAAMSGAFPNKKEGLEELFLTLERQGFEPGKLDDLQRRLGRVFKTLPRLASVVKRSRFRNKSDFYSLLVYSLKNAEHLPLSSTNEDLLGRALTLLSDRVAEIKREEGAGRSIDKLMSTKFGTESARYLRAVERAASDRLNRVKREEVLSALIDPIVRSNSPVALTPADALWLVTDDDDETSDGVDQDDPVAEREHFQEVILTVPSESIDVDLSLPDQFDAS